MEKLVRLNKNFKDLSDIQDLIGARIVALFEKDLIEIEKTIENSFSVIKKYRPDYLGTGNKSTKHIIVKLKRRVDGVSLLAEIQIMTLPQFTYSEISHRLNYKNSRITKKSKKDSLDRISVLLDVVDSELSSNLER